MPEHKRLLKIFLCHASQDKPIVSKLYHRLESERWIDTWLDEKKLLPGQDWRLNIEAAVEASDIVIVCLSSNSVNKEGFVQRELRYAKEISLEKPEGSIFLIPLRLDQCVVPRGFRIFQWEDYFGEKEDEAYDNLLKSLKLRYEQILQVEQQKYYQHEKEKIELDVSEDLAQEKENNFVQWRKSSSGKSTSLANLYNPQGLGWPNLWEFLKSLPSEPDQRMLMAFEMCPKEKSIHDIHVLRALFRLNPAFVRHPYSETLFEELRDTYDPGEYIHSQTGRPLGGTVVHSLQQSLKLASPTGVISTNSFIAAWAKRSLESSASPSSRSHLISSLMGDADTSEGSIADAPELEDFLMAMTSLPPSADDIEYIVTHDSKHIVFRPVSVLNDYVLQNDTGILLPQRAILTHQAYQFGRFTLNQIGELEELLNSDTSVESDFQKFFDMYPHFLRRWDHREIYPQVYLSREADRFLMPNFILTDRTLQKSMVVDLKLPTAKIVTRQANRDRFSTAIMDARAQLLEYRDWFEDSQNRKEARKKFGMQIYRPRLAVIIGRSSEFVDEFDHQKLTSSVNDIEIVTYDDVAEYAMRRLVMIDG